MTAGDSAGSGTHTSSQAITLAEELPAYTAYGVVSDPAILQTFGRAKLYAELQKKAQEVASPEGAIGERHVQEGRLVAPVQQVVDLVNGDVWIQANYKETQPTNTR